MEEEKILSILEAKNTRRVGYMTIRRKYVLTKSELDGLGRKVTACRIPIIDNLIDSVQLLVER